MVELICDRVASLYILRRNCRFQCWTNWSILKVCGVHSKLNTSTVRWCWQQKTKRILGFVLQKSHSHGIQRVAKIQSIFGRARRTRVISSKCLNVVIGHKEFALVAMLPVSQSWLSRPSVQRTKNNYVFAETLREKVSMSFFFFPILFVWLFAAHWRKRTPSALNSFCVVTFGYIHVAAYAIAYVNTAKQRLVLLMKLSI